MNVSMSRSRLLVVGAFVLAAAMFQPAAADDWDDCTAEAEPGRVIAGCSAIIATPEITEERLADAYQRRAFAYYDIVDNARAIADLDKVLSLQPNNAEAIKKRADAYANSDEDARAIAEYDRALKLDPTLSKARENRGYAYFDMGAFAKAAADFEDAAGKGEIYPMLWLFLSQSRADKDGAESLAANAATVTSKDWPYPIVELYLGTTTADEAIMAAAGADQRCEAGFYVGEWNLIAGRVDAARDGLRQATATCPKNFIEYSGAVAELNRLP